MVIRIIALFKTKTKPNGKHINTDLEDIKKNAHAQYTITSEVGQWFSAYYLNPVMKSGFK